jgi:solute carrier family 25 phosphate transporter 3
MDRSLYSVSPRVLSALTGAESKTMSAPVAFSVHEAAPSPLRSNFLAARGFAAAAPAEASGGIAMYSPAFYAACTVGGILSCGLTHTAVCPLDIVKCNMQVDPVKFKSIGTGFSVIMAEQGAKGLFKGWAPTLVGYSAQGACKFGFYEFFKKCAQPMRAPAAAA